MIIICSLFFCYRLYISIWLWLRRTLVRPELSELLIKLIKLILLLIIEPSEEECDATVDAKRFIAGLIITILKIKVYTKRISSCLGICSIIHTCSFFCIAAIAAYFRIEAIIFCKHMQVLHLCIYTQ